jgi:hypothetical protein
MRGRRVHPPVPHAPGVSEADDGCDERLREEPGDGDERLREEPGDGDERLREEPGDGSPTPTG